jgi:hypothetical protein
LRSAGTFRALVLTSACVAIMANAWQLLLPASVMALLFCSIHYLRDSLQTRRMVHVAISWMAVGLISYPGLFAVATTPKMQTLSRSCRFWCFSHAWQLPLCWATCFGAVRVWLLFP